MSNELTLEAIGMIVVWLLIVLVLFGLSADEERAAEQFLPLAQWLRTAGIRSLAYVNEKLIGWPVKPADQPENEPGTDDGLADTRAVPAGTEAGTSSEPVPGVSRRMTDTEIVVLLAVQRKPGGYRFSANSIAALIGQRRELTLEQVRSVRTLPPEPEYRALTTDLKPTLKKEKRAV